MSRFSEYFSSSIGKKITVALTGLFLCLFLIVHLWGNLQLFKSDGGFALNKYTVFMTSNPFIKAISYILYISILWHAFKGLHLAWQNQRARPVRYAVTNGKANSMWSSRNMGILGTIVLVFIAVHLSNFWAEYHWGELPYTRYVVDVGTGEILSTEDVTGQGYEEKGFVLTDVANEQEIHVYKDMYKVVEAGFQQPLIVLLYLLAMVALGFHLRHGFQSSFQSMGINHPKYNGAIRWVGTVIFGILIPAGFASMPIYFFFFHTT
ncbi:succinate dehydrogenase / fumarate reductase cytochrome b subunit [Anseongella ginsenosidimutans]|uniref:Succinate dehydrogenase / fumarate reductase cytochrome b subunit n=1 Tax=Anseongella ginsenosidimutans TaxID=496056 RepID=A0A4R3KXY0_9SPHI|nr:succinate dehydrogenase cytochrome b subunit [Anseongella ginsenosidimutans]QEC51520.1 succinate dehydrogenase cytochrome b subunit [Anseongella ginsenosidimutans]TCS88832.1 succinate dehydrogenase / fumarate reductase cytochrome b subunit [Anseongella ginsenosidimutans]